MNWNEAHKDQAEELRKRVEEGNKEAKPAADGYDPLLVSNLPPRSEVHKKKKKTGKKKLKYPLIRILVIFFILLPLMIISFYTFSKEARQTGNNGGNFERLDLERDHEEIIFPGTGRD